MRRRRLNRALLVALASIALAAMATAAVLAVSLADARGRARELEAAGTETPDAP